MGSFLFVDEEDLNFIWTTIQEQQLIFHPDIAPEGMIDYDKLFVYKRNKPLVLLIDRNILSSLLTFCEKGHLKSQDEAQIVGLIITWAEINDIKISAGLAIRERASQLHSQENALFELQKYFEVFAKYPGQMWLQVAEGQRTEIPPITYSKKLAQNITVDYTEGGDHYDMALASLLHIVWLYRNQAMKPVDKLQEFFDWIYDYSLLGDYILVYAAMLFTGQEYIKAPKHANSNDVGKIFAGCENQAWDFTYLTNWSVFYANTEEYDMEFLFATNDILLKRIFVDTHGPGGCNGLFSAVFAEKDYNQIRNHIEKRMRNRKMPDFGDNPHRYFQKLIEEEKQRLLGLLGNNTEVTP